MTDNQDDDQENEESRFAEQVEVYRCGTMMEANRVIDELLEPEGIDGFVHDRTSHALPARGEMGDFFIAVPVADAERARKVLKQARGAGELDPEGGEVIAG